MGRNLQNLAIQDTYEGLVQISGSQLTDGSGSLIPSLDVSASFATTASFALNVPTFDSGSLLTTASVSDATITFTKGDGSTFPIEVNNVSSSISASYATTASFALNVSTPTLQEVLNAGDTATGDINLTGDINATNITASGIEATTINVGTISGSQAYFTSASITDLTTITGSIVQIGDAFVLLNTATPTSRYAGILVEDSGSTPTNYTASFFFDSVTNDWNYEYFDGAQTDFGVALFGPEYNTKGSPTYLTTNTLPKAVGSHHLEDSSITDDGTLVSIDANISASGYVSASEFIGDGSQLTGVDAFPYTGLAEITGSLRVIGETITGASNNTITSTAGDEGLAIIGGTNNTINHTATNAFGDNMVIIGGKDSTISGNNINESAIAFARNSSVTGQYSQIFGGNSNTISSNAFGNGIVLGGGNTISSQAWNMIIAGNENTISAGGAYNIILGGRSGLLTAGAGSYTSIHGGFNATINGGSYGATLGGDSAVVSHNRSAVIGGASLATTKDDEVVVPSLSVYGETFISSSTLGTGSLIDNLGQEGVGTTEAIEHMVYCTQAEYDALTPDDNTMYVIKGSGDVVNDLLVEGRLTGAIDVLTDVAGTTTLDCSLGNYFTLAMPAGGTTALTPTNITTGQTINIKITQNATASTLTFASSIDFPGGIAFTISTGAGEVDVLTLVSFDGTSLQATGLANFS